MDSVARRDKRRPGGRSEAARGHDRWEVSRGLRMPRPEGRGADGQAKSRAGASRLEQVRRTERPGARRVALLVQLPAALTASHESEVATRQAGIAPLRPEMTKEANCGGSRWLDGWRAALQDHRGERPQGVLRSQRALVSRLVSHFAPGQVARTGTSSASADPPLTSGAPETQGQEPTRRHPQWAGPRRLRS